MKTPFVLKYTFFLSSAQMRPHSYTAAACLAEGLPVKTIEVFHSCVKSGNNGKLPGKHIEMTSYQSVNQRMRHYSLGTDVSLTSSFDLHFVEFLTNVNSMRNQHKMTPCHWIWVKIWVILKI